MTRVVRASHTFRVYLGRVIRGPVGVTNKPYGKTGAFRKRTIGGGPAWERGKPISFKTFRNLSTIFIATVLFFNRTDRYCCQSTTGARFYLPRIDLVTQSKNGFKVVYLRPIFTRNFRVFYFVKPFPTFVSRTIVNHFYRFISHFSVRCYVFRCLLKNVTIQLVS